MKKNVSAEFRALGTDVQIKIVVEGNDKVARQDAEIAKDIFFEQQKVFNRFDSESEISRLNRGLGRWEDASPDMLRLASRILHFNEISGGLFDPRVIDILEQIGYDKDFRKKDFSKMKQPPNFSASKCGLSNDLRIREGKIFFSCRMDFSGVAKGYIVDRAAECLKDRGWKNFLVDAGGDMRIFGGSGKESTWHIAIEGVPEDKLMLELSDRGIATSGITRKKWTIDGKKFHHLVNPRSPNEFSYDLRTVSVIERSAEEADGRAKTLVLMGREKGFEFATENKIAAIFLDRRGDAYVAPEARKYICRSEKK